MGKTFSLPSLPSAVASQCLWHNKYIKIDDKTIVNSFYVLKEVNLLGQFFQNNQYLKKWNELKTKYNSIENQNFSLHKSNWRCS